MRFPFACAAVAWVLCIGCRRAESEPICTGLPERRAIESISLGSDSTSAMHTARPGYRSDSDIFIAVAEGPEISGFNARGARIFRIGARGSGPGEYRSLVAASSLKPDSIISFDEDLWRFSIHAPDGRFIRSVAIEPISYGSFLGMSVVDRTVLLATLRRPDPREFGVDGLMPESLTVVAYSLDSVKQVGMGVAEVTVAGGVWKREPTVGSVRVRRLLESPSASFTASNGIAFAASGGERVLRKRERNGVWHSVTLKFLPQSQPSPTYDGPSALFDLIVAGDSGTVWIGLPVGVENTARTWVRADRDGSAGACMQLPKELWVWQVDQAGVLGRLVDHDGDDRVVFYRWLD